MMIFRISSYLTYPTMQESACVGSRQPIDLKGLISKKTCKDCLKNVVEPIPLPEEGELEPGQEIAKGDFVTRVGVIKD
jgi:hypothetical protein